MVKYFNTEASCKPEEHYMVKLDDRLAKIKRLLVDRKKYFVINCGRQYGKTTTLKALEEFLKDDFIVLFLDFQQLGTEDFADESTFTYAFADVFLRTFRNNGLGDVDEMLKPLSNVIEKRNIGLKDLFVRLSYVCMNSLHPIVLVIDEVDSARNNQVFIDFLAQKERFGLQIVFSKRVCTIIFFLRRSCQAQWKASVA